MYSYLTSWEKRLSAIVPDLSQTEDFMKKVSLALLAGQAVLCLGAVITRVMLHADGSFFAYVIAAGEPWELKWKGLTTRASTYVFTVVPTAVFSNTFGLSGEHIAAVSGLTFYHRPEYRRFALGLRPANRLLSFYSKGKYIPFSSVARKSCVLR